MYGVPESGADHRGWRICHKPGLRGEAVRHFMLKICKKYAKNGHHDRCPSAYNLFCVIRKQCQANALTFSDQNVKLCPDRWEAGIMP